MVEEFDYVVVGAGSAGCALLGGLVKLQGSVRIALVESGGDVIRTPNIATPQQWGANLGGPQDYSYQTESQVGFGERWIHYPRGHGLGGSGLINAFIYSRGFKDDWDRMPHKWRSEDMIPIFARIEECLHLTAVSPGAFGQAVLSTAKALGIPSVADSAWEVSGCMNGCKATVDNRTGCRVDLFRAFGANAENVTVLRGRATKILFDDCRGVPTAVGVQLQGQNKPVCVRQGGEVILCAGAIDTPKLLQLSGVGPKTLLDRLSIANVSALPVGHGLKDHTLLPTGAATNLLVSEPAQELSPNGIEGFINDAENSFQLMILNSAPTCGMLPFIIGQAANRRGILWLVVRGLLRYVVSPLVKVLLKIRAVRKLLYGSVGIGVCLTRPSSVGTVMVCSKNADVPATINPNFLSTEDDKQNMLRGLELAMKIYRTSPVSGIIKQMTLAPGKSHSDYIKDQCSSYYHPTGTCSIGSCLDEELRVHGVRGLRVADASSLPIHPRVPTQAACMAVGARCAELLSMTSGT